MAQQASHIALEQALREFDRRAALVGGGQRRQVWRFEFEQRGYILVFYPRRALGRKFGLSPAMTDFTYLQVLQRASVPVPHVIAQLSGFRVKGQLGDALILDEIPGAIQLDRYLQDHRLSGKCVPQRRGLFHQVIDIMAQIGRIGLGHAKPGLDCFLVAGGKVYFHGVRGLRRGGLRTRDLFTLGHSAAGLATRNEFLRGWRLLNPGQPLPRKNPLSPALWGRFVRRSQRENQDFGRFGHGQWSGYFTRTSGHAVPWSIASRLSISRRDWESAWPVLLAQLESDQLTAIKRDASGEVLEGEIVLGGRPVSVIIKRPRRKFWYRYLIELIRPAKPLRIWIKAWQLIARNIPCEWPLLVMQRKVLGYATEGMIVLERVPGESLDRIDLDQLNPRDREMLFRRAGRTTRAIELGGLAHYDAKSTNWIVFHASHGPIPVIIDVDGVRRLNVWLVAWGIRRLLRAMKQHPQYTPADSLALCQGYAPFAGQFEQEQESTPR